MKIFHRGLIIVGVPFLSALSLSITLSILLHQAEQEKSAESKLLKANALTAKFMAQVSQAPYILIAAINLNSEDYFKQAEQKFKSIENLWPEVLALNKNTKQDFRTVELSLRNLEARCQPILANRGIAKDAYEPIVLAGILTQRTNVLKAMYLTLPGEQQIIDTQKRLDQLHKFQISTLGVALLLTIALRFVLLNFYKRGILDRISMMQKNTKSLATKDWLAPEMGGDDEIAEFDHAFHQTRKLIFKASESEKSLFNNANDVICVLDAKYNFTNINAAVYKNWGYKPEEVLGRNISMLLSPEDQARVTSLIRNCTEKELTTSLEAQVKLKSNISTENLWSIYWSAANQRLYCIVHDKDRICQALVTLCKFLFLNSKQTSNIRVMARRRETAVDFKIIDQSPILDAELRTEIFDRFKQQRTIASVPGSNFNADLALPLSARIIQAHGGTIALEESQYKSNAFAITIENA